MKPCGAWSASILSAFVKRVRLATKGQPSVGIETATLQSKMKNLESIRGRRRVAPLDEKRTARDGGDARRSSVSGVSGRFLIACRPQTHRPIRHDR